MKLHKVALSAAAAFTSIAVAVPALAGGSVKDAPYKSVPGIYVELGAGAGWYPDTTWTFGTGSPANHRNDFDTGEVFRGAVGTRLSYGLRGEVEVGYRANEASSTVAGVTPFASTAKSGLIP